MQSIHLQKWHPRHWLLPLTMLGLSIMTVFILKTYVPHKGHMLPSADQFYAHYHQVDGLTGVLLLMDWYLFWALFIAAAFLLPFFMLKSIEFLRAGAHRLTDRNVMETAGWFGVPLSLAMFGNVSGFASVMLFGLDTHQDDILWPFFMVYNLVIAMMALFQFVWYRQIRHQADNATQHSMVVPFAIGFMGLNLAGPGAFTGDATLATVSMSASLLFLGISVFSFLQKIPALADGFKHLFARPEDTASQQRIWGHQVNLATAITAVNVWQITLVRNYLNYGHNFSDFSIAFKNSLTWGIGLVLPLVVLVVIGFIRSGFLRHLFTASRNYLFSLGQICMLVSSYVLTALFTGTAVKAGLIAKYGTVWNLAWTLEALLGLLTLAAVGMLFYRMVLRGNVQSWQAHEVALYLKRN